MIDLKQRIAEATGAIRRRSSFVPQVGIVLGTGLGGLSARIDRAASIPYEEIPHFARTTTSTHRGELVLGTLQGKPVAVLEGRFHLYEGYSPDQITFPIRVLRALGAGILIVSNASGGIHGSYRRGDLVLIEDHLNLMGVNPLIGSNDESIGPRFPDMCDCYDRELLAVAEGAARRADIPIRRGVYAAMTGPNLETRAEYRMLRTLGADLIGMSTVPEVIAAVHAGFRILGVSVVTDLCVPEQLQPATLAEIVASAKAAEPRLCSLIEGVISTLR